MFIELRLRLLGSVKLISDENYPFLYLEYFLSYKTFDSYQETVAEKTKDFYFKKVCFVFSSENRFSSPGKWTHPNGSSGMALPF